MVEFDRVYVLCRERDDSPRSHATTAQDLLAEVTSALPAMREARPTRHAGCIGRTTQGSLSRLTRRSSGASRRRRMRLCAR